VSDVLFVGQAPSSKSSAAEPFDGMAGSALAKLIGVSRDDFLGAFDRVNLFDRYPGRKPNARKGDAFDVAAATESAAKIAAGLTHRRVVLVGLGVARAFGLKRPRLFEWFDYGYDLEFRSVQFAVIPHTSGIVLFWNDQRNKRKARRFLRTVSRAV